MKITHFVNLNQLSINPILTSLLFLVVVRFEYSKFELFVGNLWVVLMHEYHKVWIHATHDYFFHLTITEASVSHTQCYLYCLNGQANTFEIHYNTHTHTHNTHTLSCVH